MMAGMRIGCLSTYRTHDHPDSLFLKAVWAVLLPKNGTDIDPLYAGRRSSSCLAQSKAMQHKHSMRVGLQVMCVHISARLSAIRA